LLQYCGESRMRAVVKGKGRDDEGPLGPCGDQKNVGQAEKSRPACLPTTERMKSYSEKSTCMHLLAIRLSSACPDSQL